MWRTKTHILMAEDNLYHWRNPEISSQIRAVDPVRSYNTQHSHGHGASQTQTSSGGDHRSSSKTRASRQIHCHRGRRSQLRSTRSDRDWDIIDLTTGQSRSGLDSAQSWNCRCSSAYRRRCPMHGSIVEMSANELALNGQWLGSHCRLATFLSVPDQERQRT